MPMLVHLSNFTLVIIVIIVRNSRTRLTHASILSETMLADKTHYDLSILSSDISRKQEMGGEDSRDESNGEQLCFKESKSILLFMLICHDHFAAIHELVNRTSD